MYDLLLFPGRLSSNKEPVIIRPGITQNPVSGDYLKEGNFLSEFDTLEERDRVVLNLGLDDYFVLEDELEDIIEDKFKDAYSWIDA